MQEIYKESKFLLKGKKKVKEKLVINSLG